MTRALLLAVVLLGACRPSEDECGRLLDHFLDVEGAAATQGKFRAVTDRLADALTEEKHRFRRSLEADFVGKCRAQLSRAEVTCALSAADEPGLDACEGR